ncbi:MAG: fumarylacetoacetate hydrolase family protein [Pseudomonadota bacterium]|nr:fumarylacetoacetate hydrolase family protein [Pseudomonadota bacterium]
MKLATYRDGSRDGQLIVVSRDLTLAHHAFGVASRMQQVLDDWKFLSPQLEEMSQALNHGKLRHAFGFDPRLCLAPLPRAYRWATGPAYPNHLALLSGARDGTPQAGAEPWLTLGGSDDLAGPHDPIALTGADLEADFGATVAVICGDVALGTPPEAAIDAVRLVMLANDISLRAVLATDATRAHGPVQGQPATAFSPVAVTPDELEDAWQGGRVHLNLECRWNGQRVGRLETGPEMRWHFGDLIAHLARTRRLRAGSIVGAGTVSNADPARGYACVAEQRARETLAGTSTLTRYLEPGDTVAMDMRNGEGPSVFGAIEQDVVAARTPGGAV